MLISYMNIYYKEWAISKWCSNIWYENMFKKGHWENQQIIIPSAIQNNGKLQKFSIILT